ncbi:MAG: histidine--tRNA ligase [Campylobacterales bacterium]|nr:histidine--tRNA ligase [Campylobacterales bacterium]
MISALRGMKDTLGPENSVYAFVISECVRLAKNYGFELIETPILEETALFKRSVGESSDIVGKEMYQFTDKGGNDVCMRPEGTAGVVRAFVQHKMDKAGGVKRFFYHGPMYRYERPQKGRLRQFHQFGVESFGESDVKEDASVILLLAEILRALGIKATLKLNSLGCPACMPVYREKLIAFLDAQEGLCEDCLRRKTTNPIRVLDCKNEHCQTLLAPAPRITNHLCAPCKEEFSALQGLLKGFNVPFEVDSSLVRGLDYYSKTAFEFVSDEIGAQSSIAGGGRYDRLVEFLDGKPTPGIGFAMGIERLLELVVMPESSREGIYLGALCEEAIGTVYALAIQKRASEKVMVDYQAKSLKAHLKQADKKETAIFACIGEDELKEGMVWVKDLITKTETRIPLKDF